MLYSNAGIKYAAALTYHRYAPWGITGNDKLERIRKELVIE
jgi:hypothetical protein